MFVCALETNILLEVSVWLVHKIVYLALEPISAQDVRMATSGIL